MLLISFAVTLHAASVPKLINYQGVLKDTDGTIVEDGTYTITFNLYNVSTGGSTLWTENHSVTVESGIFDVNLGSTNSINLDFEQQYWLGINIDNQGELSPRLQFTSTPYSFITQSIVEGKVVSSLNGIRDDVVLTEGDNIEITNYGNSITISALVPTESFDLPYTGFEFESSDVFSITNVGTGSAIVGVNGGAGHAAEFWSFDEENSTSTISVGSEGTGAVMNVGTTASAFAGFFHNDEISELPPLVSSTKGNTAALYVSGEGTNSDGIWVSVPTGNYGLYVIGGTKNAVVSTSQGATELYTEESSEVWFTDYGFGELVDGNALVNIDPLFAETVSTSEPYHVFIEEYGNADLYVTNKTHTSFEVRLRDGDSDVEFSYRIVAKRKGYENTRLEHNELADNDPNLDPSAPAKAGTSQHPYYKEMMKAQEEFKREMSHE